MSRTRIVLAVGAVAGAFALAGCGAGQITQTSTQQSGVEGASANIGQIAVRGAEFTFAGDGKSAVAYPSGGAAPLSMTVANFGAQPDELMAVSSPAAASVEITGDGTVSAGKLLIVQGAPTPAPTAEVAPTTVAPAQGAGTLPTVGATSAEVAPSAAPASPAARSSAGGAPSTVAANATVSAAPSEAAAPPTPSPEGTTSAQVVLAGLKQDVKAGLTYPVVLTFQRAGDVTLQVPVGNPKDGSTNE